MATSVKQLCRDYKVGHLQVLGHGAKYGQGASWWSSYTFPTSQAPYWDSLPCFPQVDHSIPSGNVGSHDLTHRLSHKHLSPTVSWSQHMSVWVLSFRRSVIEYKIKSRLWWRTPVGFAEGGRGRRITSSRQAWATQFLARQKIKGDFLFPVLDSEMSRNRICAQFSLASLPCHEDLPSRWTGLHYHAHSFTRACSSSSQICLISTTKQTHFSEMKTPVPHSSGGPGGGMK